LRNTSQRLLCDRNRIRAEEFEKVLTIVKEINLPKSISRSGSA
jgi:hypothetical protein